MKRVGFWAKRLVCALCTFTLVVVSMPALDPVKSPDQYIINTWTAENGLPQNTINTMAQTEDGYLWFGTQDGLVRFNGNGFKIFDRFNTPSLKTSFVNVLCKTRDGSLWIGCEVGGLVRYKDGAFTRLEVPEIFPGNLSISALAEDSRGNLWIAADGRRLYVKKEEGVMLFRFPENITLNDFRHLRFDREDRLWIATRGGLIQYHQGGIVHLTVRDGLSSDNTSVTYQDRSGNVWIGTEGGGLNLYKNGKFTHFTTKDGLPNSDVLAIQEDSQGNLWVGTRGGLVRVYQGAISRLTTRNGLSNDTVAFIMEDREGSLWLGTSLGINRLRDGRVVTMGATNGLPTDFIWSVYEDRERVLWIGTHGSGLVRMQGTTLRTLAARDGLPSNVVRCTLQDSQGRFWIGTLGGLCLMEKGKLTSFSTRHGLSSNIIRAVYEDSAGVIWIGTANGLDSFKQGRFFQFPLTGVPQPTVVFSLFQDREGSLWVGTRRGAIKISGDRRQVLDENSGFTSGNVYSFLQDQAGRFWIGTNDGICLHSQGRFHFFNKMDGLPDNVIYKILADSSGNLVMSSNRGIIIQPRRELLDHAAGRQTRLHPEVLGLEDGLKTTECNGGSQSAGCIGFDGKIYFPTLKGIAIMNPGYRKENKIIPPVKIEEIFADGRSVFPDQKEEMPAGTSRIEFHFAALSYLAPEKVKFKYRLEGLDQEWIEAGNRREAYYTNLSPGDYAFRVIACNNDGLWNTAGAIFSFTKKPFFYQTKLFYFLIIFSIFLAGSGVNHMRVQKLKKREKELAQLVAERTQELARANQELERLSLTDSLTQLPNRRNFELIFAQEWKRCSRESQPLSLLMIDIDFFKLYNDTYGHPVGDECLKQIAASIHRCASRAGDFVARLGGEEFVVILPNTHSQGAGLIAERVRKSAEELMIPHSGSTISPVVTISIGVAMIVPDRGMESDTLIAAADQALYQAKKQGRNRIRTAAE